MTGVPWKDPDWGTALGAGCAVFMTDGGARKSSVESLWTILWSESVHLVWKLRCERVIRNEGADFSDQEIENRWYAAIDRRLTLDRRTSVLNRSKKGLTASKVSQIWGPIIENFSNLPTGWVGNSGVLVGIKRGR
ncbi:hypothetical protein LXA43DRAFT_887218 [Ganoderma leucocontextum]|nr:hypothetical protein LXA43DRAFT_887218 [Ganoderma leucocontextum]